MAKWVKKGLIFRPQDYEDPAWRQEFAQAPSVIIYDNYIRVYYSTRPKPINGQYKSYSGFVDLLRSDLRKIIKVSDEPILALGSIGTFDEFGTYPVSVIHDDQGAFICYYAGWTRCVSVPFNVAIGVAKSSDGGKSFAKLGEGPILSYSLDEPFILSGPKIRKFKNLWVLFYIAGREWILDNGKAEPVYKIRMATSEDGLKWDKFNKDIIESKVLNEAQASPDVFFHKGMYHMFFCYRYGSNYRGKKFGYRIGYASSTDMYNWQRDDKKVGIDVSEQGWDSEMISYPHVFKLDEKIYMLYLGNQVGKEGFGLAELQSGSLND